MNSNELKTDNDTKIVSSKNTGSQSMVHFTRPFIPVVHADSLTLSHKITDYEITFGIGQFNKDETNDGRTEVNIEANKMKVFKMPLMAAPLRMGGIMNTVQWSTLVISVFFSIY